MNSPVFMMIINSSYVLISTTPFRKARNGWLGRLPASLISILYLARQLGQIDEAYPFREQMIK